MTVKTRLLRLALLVGCAAVVARAAVAQEITIWHDKGDDGIRMIQQMADKYKTDHPGVTVKSVSMPTDQWFSRSIAALNTGTSPDILFNDNARIVTIQQSTGKLTDLTQQFQLVVGRMHIPVQALQVRPAADAEYDAIQSCGAIDDRAVP